MPKKSRKTVRKEVYDSLIAQLKGKSADIALYVDQVDDYMHLWDLKEMLIADIEQYGLTRSYSSDKGTVEKDNPSPKQLPIVNRQMLAILQQLGISTDSVGGGGSYVSL